MIDEKTKNKFLWELGKGGNVYFSCLKTGIARATYYRWKTDNEEFRKKADEAEHQGRENNCDIAEQALMINVKEKKMDAIKYVLSHNSPRYKPKDITIIHKKEGEKGGNSESRPVVLIDLIRKAEESNKETIKKIRDSFASRGEEIPRKLNGEPIGIDELMEYEKYIKDWEGLNEEQKEGIRKILSSSAEKEKKENEQAIRIKGGLNEEVINS